MNRNNMLLVGLAVFFVIGVGLTAYMFSGRNAAVAPVGPVPTPAPVKTYVAVNDIPPRTVIKANMLRETESKPTAGAITDLDQVVGKLTTEPIYKGQVVKSGMAVEELERVIPASFGIPREGPDDLRAVAVWVDPLQTAAGLVDKGDRVDVIAVHKLKNPGGTNTGDVAAGRTIAQDLQVLAVDRSLEVSLKPTPVPVSSAPGAPPAPAPPPPAPTPPPPAGQKTFTRVVVAAPPVVAERLVAANATGELHLTIRDPQSRENFPIPGVREYPALPIDPTVQKVRDAAVQRRLDNIRRTDERRWRLIEAQDTKRLNPPIPNVNITTPMNTGALPTPVPMPDVREITVVRGTEKTRVVVPR